MSKSEIKRVYIIRPERKSIQKHLTKELGSKSKENARINAQVVVVRTFEELYQYIKQKNLSVAFGGTLQHDYMAWLAVQKTLTQYYLLVNNVATSSADVLQRIRDVTSGDLGTRTSEKSTERAQRKRLRNIEKKRNEILRQYNFTKAMENGQRLHSYFQDPKLNENFQTLSKSPVFEWDKTRFQQYYRKMLAVRDRIEHAWKEGVGKMKSLATEQELYDRLIECCTWIVEEGLPYLTSLPAQSKTLAEAVKQKINFENECYKPVKVTLRKCRQTLKEVRHYQRSLRTRNGSLELMADNLTSLVENLKTKSEERMEHFKNEKDFMHALAKAESWCERASDLWPANQIPIASQENTHRSPTRFIDPRIELFLERHPPLTRKELGHLLDYVENIDDLELRNRARLLGNRCQELERILRARETHVGDFNGEEESSDLESSNGQNQSSYDRNSSLKRRTHREDTQSPLRSTISTDVSTKRWHDDVMSSTTISNDDVIMSRSGTADLGIGNENSRLADIKRRLRDQELLYEQLILEEEIRELTEGNLSPEQAEVSVSSSLNGSRSFGIQNWDNVVSRGTSGKAFEKGNKAGKYSNTELRNEQAEICLSSSFDRSFKHPNRMVKSGSSGKSFENINKAEQDKKAKFKNEGPGAMMFTSSLNRSGEVEKMDSMVSPNTSGKAFEKHEIDPELRNEGTGAMSFTSSFSRSGELENIGTIFKGNTSGNDRTNETVNISADEKKRAIVLLQIDSHNPSCSGNGNWENVARSEETEKQSKRNLPSHVDLLDGCNSLKRLCKLGNPLAHNNTITAFETYYSPDKSISVNNRSTQMKTSPSFILPNSNVTIPTTESVFGAPIKFRDSAEMSSESRKRSHDLENSVSDPESSSRDIEFHSLDLVSHAPDSGSRSCDYKEYSHDIESTAAISSTDTSPEALINAASEAVDITHDSENRSRELECRSHDPGSSSRGIESFSLEFEGQSHDVEDLSHDSNDSSREELLKAAREAVNHWTRIKNEQRARLAQVIDNIPTRKEIEESYFNAQIQLCRARQNVAKLSKSDTSLTTLSLNNDVINYSMTSSFNTSSEFHGEGAFRRFVKDHGDSVEENSNSEKTACLEGRKGSSLVNKVSLVEIIGVNGGDEKEVLLDNEDSLAVTGGVEQDMGGSLGSKRTFGDVATIPSEKAEIPSHDHLVLQENEDKFDSEQGSSDEFDDDVEEEELMLLCSQSSSGLISQDELKDSLREEQARLEEMFRQQKEQLRLEREKLMEDERNIYEWEHKKLELKEDIGIVKGHMKTEGSKESMIFFNNIESNVLDKIGEDEKIDLQHEILQPHHDLPQPQHDRHESQHDVYGPGHDIPVPEHEIPSPQHEIRSPHHEIPSLQHEIPSPEHDLPSSQHEIPSTQHEIPSTQHEILSAQHEIPSTQHEIAVPQHEIHRPQNDRTSPRNEQRQQQHEIKHRSLPQHEIKKPQHNRIEKEHEVEHLRDQMVKLQGEQQKQSSYFETLKRKDTLPTKMESVDQNANAYFREHKGFSIKNTDEDISIESDANDLNEIVVSNFDSDDESREEIEEELINILQERPLDIEQEKSEVLRPNFPPLGMEGNPPSMLHHNDDIDEMNQLIDDLMIRDQDRDNQGDYDGVNLDRIQINGGDHGMDVDTGRVDVDNGRIDEGDLVVYVDNLGVNLGDDGINEGNIGIDVDSRRLCVDNGRIYEEVGVYLDNVGINLDGDGGINEGNVEIDVDSGGVNVDNSGISEVGVHDNVGINLLDYGVNVADIDLGNLETNNDKREANMDNYLIDLNIADDVGTNRDHFGMNSDDHEDDFMDKMTSDLDNIWTKVEQNGSDDFQSADHLKLEGLHYDDKMLGESESPRDERSAIDVDFTIDLTKDSEAVHGNDLIGLLRSQSDAFSSQESLDADDEDILERNSEILHTSKTEYNDKIIGTGSNSIRKEEVTLEREGKLDGHQIHRDSEGLYITEATGDINEEHSKISGYTEDQHGIHEGHQLMSEESDDDDDDDFSRVLEDIQEEESEYEDLMGYRATHVDSNDNKVQEQSKIIVPSSSVLRTARYDDHNMNAEDSAASSSFTSSIIIDPGTGYCKAGFSVDDQPRVTIPSVVGKPKSQVVHSGRYKECYVGEEAKHLHQVLNLHHPLKNGLVEDWELMEKLLDEVYEELRCESDQYPVLLSEPVLNPKSNREEMIQVMFETFHVPAAYSCAQAVLSLFATGRTTGLVYDCGYCKAHSVPVYEGYALPHATTTTELAGHELTTCLSRMFRDRGVTMETQAELDIVRDIKEKLCYVVMDYDSERKAYNIGERNDTTYTMPDGQSIGIGSERFRCPEVMFTPSMIGMATDGVHEIIYKTALQCAIDVRSSLFQNIVISGGSTMFPGFSRRLHVELCKLLGTRTPDSINIDAVDDRNMLTWQGGAMLSKLSNFKSMWITSSEYEEFGPGIVHKKCV